MVHVTFTRKLVQKDVNSPAGFTTFTTLGLLNLHLSLGTKRSAQRVHPKPVLIFHLSDLNNGDQLAVALSLLSSATTTTNVTASRVVPLYTLVICSGSSICSRHRHSFTIRSPMHIIANCLILIALWSIHRHTRPFRRWVA